jgi:hypothetical protein
MAVIVIVKHRSNLMWRLKGQEPKMSFKKKDEKKEESRDE